MTTTEFKQKYPQYKDLEGDELWDMMTDCLCKTGNKLYPDPTQERVFHKPIKIDVLQKDGCYAKQTIVVEDGSKTRWLDEEGNLVRVGEIPMVLTKQMVSYSMVIWDTADSNV
jgi:hypothetical protein